VEISHRFRAAVRAGADASIRAHRTDFHCCDDVGDHRDQSGRRLPTPIARPRRRRARGGPVAYLPEGRGGVPTTRPLPMRKCANSRTIASAIRPVRTAPLLSRPDDHARRTMPDERSAHDRDRVGSRLGDDRLSD
jgi:hypothetical protein